MIHPNIVVLAGGISSRMKRLPSVSTTTNVPLLGDAEKKSKVMIGVGEDSRPFLDYLLYNLEHSGYEDVVIVVSERDNSIREFYEQRGNARRFPQLRISYAAQAIPRERQKPLGTADAVLHALRSRPEWKGKSFTVCNGDNLYSQIALRLLLEDRHENALIDYDRAALQFDQDRIAQFAVIKKDEAGFLRDIIEKPSLEEIDSVANGQGRVGVSMNIFRFSYDCILPFLESVPLHPVRQEKELSIAVKMMVAERPRSMFTIPLSEHVVDLTSQGDIPVVRAYLHEHFASLSKSS